MFLENEITKLGNFGLMKVVNLNSSGAKDLEKSHRDTAGAIYWQAPEVLQSNAPYGRKADIWY